MFLINEKIVNRYPRTNIEEDVVGCKHEIYKIIDNKPEYKVLTQKLVKSDIKKTSELFKGLAHIKIAYQNYIIEDIDENILIANLEREFGSWLDSEYPIYKRQKHIVELTRNPKNKREKEIKAWQDWEFEQRDLLKEKINNKDYIFNFNPKID